MQNKLKIALNDPNSCGQVTDGRVEIAISSKWNFQLMVILQRRWPTGGHCLECLPVSLFVNKKYDRLLKSEMAQSLSVEDVKQRWPLHYYVWNKDIEGLEKHLKEQSAKGEVRYGESGSRHIELPLPSSSFKSIS